MSYTGSGSITIVFQGSTCADGNETVTTIESTGDDDAAFSAAHKAIHDAQVASVEAKSTARSATPDASPSASPATEEPAAATQDEPAAPEPSAE